MFKVILIWSFYVLAFVGAMALGLGAMWTLVGYVPGEPLGYLLILLAGLGLATGATAISVAFWK